MPVKKKHSPGCPCCKPGSPPPGNNCLYCLAGGPRVLDVTIPGPINGGIPVGNECGNTYVGTYSLDVVEGSPCIWTWNQDNVLSPCNTGPGRLTVSAVLQKNGNDHVLIVTLSHDLFGGFLSGRWEINLGPDLPDCLAWDDLPLGLTFQAGQCCDFQTPVLVTAA